MRSRMRKSRTYGSVRGWHREVPVYSTWNFLQKTLDFLLAGFLGVVAYLCFGGIASGK